MYRITTVGSLPLGLSRRLLAQCFASLFVCLMAFCGLALFGGLPLQAQSTSGGGITGIVTDPTGAVVAKAQVTATDTDTGVQTTRQSTSSGSYSIAPLSVGTYNVEVVAKGFQRLLQENVTVDNASMFGLNLKLSVGAASDTITVTDAPPYMNTTDATLGGTIENELYSALPLSMNGGPRDPTAFQYLMPGVQENPGNNIDQGSTAGSSGIYGGTGQANLNQNYVEGVPVSNISAQGSGTQVANAVSVDAVNQFSVQTSGASTSFGGAGVTNYTINSGGNQFHGTAFDFIRNTDFDTWGYFSKVANASTGLAVKPGEHQNSYGFSIGGPILKDKLFFFGSYEGYRYTKISNTPQIITIPTLANRVGNFTDKFGTINEDIADPTNASWGSRPAFTGMLNGVATLNVIPQSEISNISQAMQASLPPPTTLATVQNYFAVLPQANNNYTVDVKIDYTLNSRNKFSLTGLGGLVGYGGAPAYQSPGSSINAYSQLPIPYAAGKYTDSKTASGIFKYTYIASQSLINSLSYGFTRNWGEGFSLTKGTAHTATTLGITNLPPGGASENMPSITWDAGSGPTAPSPWASISSTGPVGRNAFTIIDNLTWIKRRHNITFGAQAQWLETNSGTYAGYSQSIGLQYSAHSTELCTQGSNSIPCANAAGFDGDAYASFLVGAVYSSSVNTQTIQDVGARYRPLSPYIQDNWQVSPKLTLNIGLRYDYLQPYHEVHDRIAFLNSKTINPIVGIPGVLEYAGFPDISQFPGSTNPIETPAQQLAIYAPYICHCTTPVKPYNNNFQPRLGFNYAINSSTTISGAYGMSLTHSGGVGGGDGATAATGNNSEYSATTRYSTSSTGNPVFFLNPNFYSPQSTPPSNEGPPIQGTQGIPVPPSTVGPPIACIAAGTCSPFSAIPPWTAPGTNTNPLATTGNYNWASYFGPGGGGAGLGLPLAQNDYNCSSSGTYCTTQGVNFADPYYGGRGPQFITYSAGIQHMINKKAVLSINYSGTQTHFLPHGSGRGPATNTYSPDYDQEYEGVLGNNGYAGSAPPYPLYGGVNATIGQSLKAFPQFGNFTDIWGNTGNANYNSLQVSVVQRPWHNLSGFVNYTRAKEIDDTGNHRTQYPVGPQDGNFGVMSANRVDRGLGTSNQTNAFNLTWVYTFPIGRGQAFFATNRIAGMIGAGWEFSGIYKYRDGSPLQITGPGCATGSYGQGTCYPDYSPGFDKRQARINGRWGRGPGSNALTYNSIPYLNPLGFQCPDSSPERPTASCGSTEEPGVTFKLGNVARSAPYGIMGPGWWDVDLGLRRTFNVRETATLHLTFQVEADVTNATNSTFYNVGATQWNASGYGTINGQNQQIQPRDWQFAGRFRF